MPMIGRELGRYRIESKLGEGGMGVVYGALDTALNRHVALKVLAAGRVADPARRERFIQEAQAASALNHPGIVTVHDIASHDGVDFIVMELIEGKTLDHVIGGTGMGVIRALRLGAALADALARAHHRRGAGSRRMDVWCRSHGRAAPGGRAGLAPLADAASRRPAVGAAARLPPWYHTVAVVLAGRQPGRLHVDG
jgi:serine/threonine protein kinase